MVRYLILLFVFALGLLAKPMLVTLPLVLLLLDYWPLGQNSRQEPNGIFERALFDRIAEKIPLLLLSGLSVYLASSSLRGFNNYIPLESIPMTLRIENALVSYIKYIGKMIWPANLAVFYPYPDTVPEWQVVGALIFIVCISILVLYRLKQHAYLAVGWFWFMGTLFPVSGILQAGLWPAMADRWAYVPLIGLFIMIVWGGNEIVNRWRLKSTPVACTSLAILMTLIMVSRIQVGYWTDSITIFKHAIAATGGSWVAHNNLGNALTDIGNEAQAFQHYSAALRHNPNSAHIHVNFGSALLARGKIDEAVDHFEHALKLDPDFTEAYNNLGLAHVRKGNIDKAVYLFRIAHRKSPAHTNVNQNLKLALSIQEKINRAAGRMHRSLNIDPAESGLDLKMIELSKRKRELMEAVNKFQKALARQPGFVQLEAENISAVQTVMKEYDRLLPLFLKINEIQPGSADTSYHIACLYSRKGMAEESIKWLDKALGNDPSRREFYLADPDLEHINP
jgi:tetratricopeptide (TPR) repeat protein